MLAELARGMCNPDGQRPVIDGPSDQAAVQRDSRNAAQPNRDGLNSALRAAGALKPRRHNGLPATIVATTTLADLEAAAGTGLTGGGTGLPMTDAIRLARDVHRYLAHFDNGKALPRYITKRLACPGQRIILYANGCHSSVP